MRALDTAETLAGPFARLERMAERHRDGLRSALHASAAEWELIVRPAFGEHFGDWWEETAARNRDGRRITYAVLTPGGEVIGTTSFHDPSPADASVEVGATWYREDARGGPVNPQCKRLLLGHAFDAGAERVQIVTDGRNLRSQAAIAKLGAVREGVLRRHRRIWTGHLRDSVIYAVLAEEWPRVRAGLDARLAAATR